MQNNLEIRHILRCLTQILSTMLRKLKKRMNEPKQMMLDLQKNETKGSEFYPNVSFMSTDNFEREMPLVKARSALLNAMKGERCLGAIFIKKQKKTGYK